MRAAALDDLAQRLHPGERALVRTRRCHHLEGVGQPDDPRAKADLVARQTRRIPAAVEMLVMLDDDFGIFAKPGRERRREPRADLRVHAQPAPFRGCRLRGLAKQASRHVELADVVDQGGPAQPVAVGFRQLHLLRDHVGEHAYPIGVPPGHPVVLRERSHQREDRHGRLGRLGFGNAVRQEFEMPH